jgi:hypothetical protein
MEDGMKKYPLEKLVVGEMVDSLESEWVRKGDRCQIEPGYQVHGGEWGVVLGLLPVEEDCPFVRMTLDSGETVEVFSIWVIEPEKPS